MDAQLEEIAKTEIAHRITMQCIVNKMNPIEFFEANKEAISQQIKQEYGELVNMFNTLSANNKGS